VNHILRVTKLIRKKILQNVHSSYTITGEDSILIPDDLLKHEQIHLYKKYPDKILNELRLFVPIRYPKMGHGVCFLTVPKNLLKRNTNSDLVNHSKTKLILSPFFNPDLGQFGPHDAVARIRVQAKVRQGRCQRADVTRCARTRTRMLSSRESVVYWYSI
jgi:hypothetical protein